MTEANPSSKLTPGMVVEFRGRKWVLLSTKEKVALRPLMGGESAQLVLEAALVAYLAEKFKHEAITPSSFDPPVRDSWVGNRHNFLLFQEATRLLLRDGVSPFRSLGKVSIRPRPYQLVPLLMALRLDPVRLLIADDVGVGKTIEAGLILRELMEAREIKRVAILTPPHLMEQWTRELSEKFALEPTPISPATLGRLERGLPRERSVYAHYPVQVISIDFVKQGTHRNHFLKDAPELVVVDEAHGAVGGIQAEGHLRYELVRELAKKRERHLLFLTATPHSGIPEAFGRLLGLLDPEFATWNLEQMNEEQRTRLARHFVQRTRRDVLETWGGNRLFPEREVRYEGYTLSQPYQKLYAEVYRYATEIVRSGEALEERRRRMRWWAALGLLRATMSSPRAAQSAFERRGRRREAEEEMDFSLFASQTYEDSNSFADDEIPHPLLEEATKGDDPSLARLKALAEKIEASEDSKARELSRIVSALLAEGHSPVVWCHFVDTANYVGEVLRRAFTDVEVGVVTGRLDPELRRQEIQRLRGFDRRILVATDCVSEGVNLQSSFSACVHYDLPWNPNRLEQREGRVDRYGQPKEKVVVVRYLGRDNSVDQAVEEVLLRKAEKIRRSLGIYVPVPREEEYVVNRMVRQLFYEKGGVQVSLFDSGEEADKAWELDAERERISRTRFAQRALKVEEVMESLEENDAVLGDPEAVKRYFLGSLQFFGVNPEQRDGVYFLDGRALGNSTSLPEPVRKAIPDKSRWAVAFEDPPPEGAEFVGRNHPFMVALSRCVYEWALGGKDAELKGKLGRWCAFRSAGVERSTYLYLLRPRYQMELGGGEVLGEEVIFIARRGAEWLGPKGAQALAELPVTQALSRPEAEEHLELALALYREEENKVKALMLQRAQEVGESQRKVRRAARMRTRGIEVNFIEADLLGVKLLLPELGR
jgi:superfamily II DNA or RNA helicase